MSLKYNCIVFSFFFLSITSSYSKNYIFGRDSLKMIKHLEKSIIIKNTPLDEVFAYMDRIGNTGEHMTKKSMAMMGSKLKLTQLSENATGLNSSYKWTGKTMGFKMDFTVLTTQWEKDKEKTWETVGSSKMIILKWYRMKFKVISQGDNTRVDLCIDYTKPHTFFFRSVGFLLAKPYAKWCLKKMLFDTKDHFESIKTESFISFTKVD